MVSITKRECVFWSAIAIGAAALVFVSLGVARSEIHPALTVSPSVDRYEIRDAGLTVDRVRADLRKSETRDRELTTSLLVESIVQIESSGRARMVGRHGERGLMQIKKGTWGDTTQRIFGHRVSFERAFEPALNRRVGTAYLAYLHDFLQEHRAEWKSDERSLLLACYNAGPNRVRAAGFSIKHLPAQTRDYVARGSALHEHYLSNHGLSIARQYAAASPAATPRS